ncbi:MAG: hypothetical protein P8X47_13765 [Ignavibacteriaceae bacterium]
MIQHRFLQKLFTVLTILAIVAFIGCEKKTEQKQDEVKKETTMPDTSSSVSEPNNGEPMAQQPVVIPDLKGKWTGTFDKRSTTFTITEQTDSSFSGKITINYRQVINQDVKGSFSPSTGKMTMTDQLHSRYQGKYNGKLSNDFTNFAGTFIMKLDGSKFSFNLNKK